MEFHEIAALFPEMTEEVFAEHKADIAANGQLMRKLDPRHGNRRTMRVIQEREVTHWPTECQRKKNPGGGRGGRTGHLLCGV